MTGETLEPDAHNSERRDLLAGSPGSVMQIADLARQAGAHRVVEIEDARTVGVVLQPGESLHTFDMDDYSAVPYRKTGTVLVEDAQSLIEYVKRHRTARGTTLWSDVTGGRVTAVLDDHEMHSAADSNTSDEFPDGLAGHGDHRAVLTLPTTPDWDLWLKQDGTFLGQQEFAEHLEDGANAVYDPDPATMLEIAQTFIATNGVQFKSSHRLDSGQTQFRYEEEVNATAGRSGEMRIPETIELRLQPFEGGPTYPLTARFRYRITNGGLRLAYRLIRPDVVRRQAFTDITTQIGDGTGLQVLAGTPRPA